MKFLPDQLQPADILAGRNTDPAANMFSEVESKGKKKYFAKGFVTLEYACLACHGSRDKTWASKNAEDYHGLK